MSQLKIKTSDNDLTFPVKIVPASSKDAITGIWDGMLKVKIAAPPEYGKANKALIVFLSKLLGIKKNSVTIVTGLSNPIKQIKITQMTKKNLLEKIQT